MSLLGILLNTRKSWEVKLPTRVLMFLLFVIFYLAINFIFIFIFFPIVFVLYLRLFITNYSYHNYIFKAKTSVLSKR